MRRCCVTTYNFFPLMPCHCSQNCIACYCCCALIAFYACGICLFLRHCLLIIKLNSSNVQVIHNRNVQFQKLTRNLFVTLHGHNVHRQQRQLSKFLMRYQQFASHAYCGAAGPVSKMASQQGKAFCVLRFEVSRSVITVQREFRARFRKDASCVFSKHI